MHPERSPMARERQVSPVSFNFLFFVVLLSVFFVRNAAGQATVNEGLETATLYVDTVTGSDTNPGTKTKPLKTIGAAASAAETNNQNSIGTKVIINPGTYRETITLKKSNKDTSLPMTFEAA